MLNQLRIKRDRLALEAFSGADVKQILTNTFPEMVRDLMGFVNRFAPDTPAIVLNSKYSEFVREINKHAYLDLAPLAAFVPEGLNVTYDNYLDELEKAVKHASGVLDDVMSPYSVFLSQLISNTDQKFNTASFNSTYNRLATARDNLNTGLGNCFTNGSTRVERTIGDVIARNTDWTMVLHRNEQLSKTVNKIDRKVLNKKIAECNQLLEAIIAKINRNDFDGASPQVVTNLADGAYQVASELEFYSAIYYKVMALTEAINRTMAHFFKVFDK